MIKIENPTKDSQLGFCQKLVTNKFDKYFALISW